MAILMFNTVIRDLTTEEMVDENASVYDDHELPLARLPVMRETPQLEEEPARDYFEVEEVAVSPPDGEVDEPAVSYEQVDGDYDAPLPLEDIEAFIRDRSSSVCSRCGMNDVDQQDGVCDSCYDAEQNSLENEEVAI